MRFKHLKAAILDWAGTTVDFGSRAPVAALDRVFRARGIALSVAECRTGMGRLKKDHIRIILEQPRVSALWKELNGAPPSERDVERIYRDFIPAQTGVLAGHSGVIAGVSETVEAWRSAGLRMGTTTGYTEPLMRIVLDKASRQGYTPDANVTPDMVGGGRPLPFMMYRNAIDLGVYPLWACVKIGDTPADIEEGLNAGSWTVGITRTGNEVGLSEEELASLSGDERARRIEAAANRLRCAGAHFVAGSVAECESVLEEIESRLHAGHGPWPRTGLRLQSAAP